MPKAQVDPCIESLADALAVLLVAEWRTQHPAQQMGHIPPGDITIGHRKLLTSHHIPSADTNDHEAVPKPSTKARGALRPVPASDPTVIVERKERAGLGGLSISKNTTTFYESSNDRELENPTIFMALKWSRVLGGL